MSRDVIIGIGIDDSEMDAKVARQQNAIDKQEADWRSKRNQILLEINSINLGISMMVQSLRMVVQITGQTLSPMESAALTMISSTVSMMTATATAMATTGILAGAAVILAAAAYGLSIGQTIKITAEYQALRDDFAAINMRLARVEGARFTMGRSF